MITRGTIARPPVRQPEGREAGLDTHRTVENIMDDIMCIIGVGLLGLILVLLGGFMWSEAKLEGRSELGLALALIGACFLFMDIVIGAQWLNDHLR